MTRTFVLYHHDNDGFGAAWAVWKKLGNGNDDHVINYISVNYGQPFPDLDKEIDWDISAEEVKREENADRHIIIVDFSYNRETLLSIKQKCKSLLVLDHHVTAQQELKGLNFAKFDMNKSGAVMAWEHFHGPILDLMLAYIQDYDLWQFQLPYSKEINAALSSYPKSFDIWDKLTIPQLQNEGIAIFRYQNQLIDRICQQSYIGTMPEGFRVPIVNTMILQSEVGNKLLEREPNCLFSACWHEQPDGKIAWSLRSLKDKFHVGDYAKRQGGGGHPTAAGFIKAPNIMGIK